MTVEFDPNRPPSHAVEDLRKAYPGLSFADALLAYLDQKWRSEKRAGVVSSVTATASADGVLTWSEDTRAPPASTGEPATRDPLPMLLSCPLCKTRHVDEGESALNPHHTHRCLRCGFQWRPALGNTVGVWHPDLVDARPDGAACPEVARKDDPAEALAHLTAVRRAIFLVQKLLPAQEITPEISRALNDTLASVTVIETFLKQR